MHDLDKEIQIFSKADRILAVVQMLGFGRNPETALALRMVAAAADLSDVLGDTTEGGLDIHDEQLTEILGHVRLQQQETMKGAFLSPNKSAA